MKKIFSVITMAIVMMLAVQPCAAQNKTLAKQLKKEYKQKMKEYKKDGWKVFATSRSLDVVLLKHYDKLESLGENGYEVMGYASNLRTKNVARQVAINNACNTYAREAGSKVKGRVVSDLSHDANYSEAEFDKFYAAYEALVEKEIRGEMQESYSVIHENADGSCDVQVFFIINEDAACRARIRAWENSMRESEAAQKYAETVSNFIKEGFDPNNNDSK